MGHLRPEHVLRRPGQPDGARPRGGRLEQRQRGRARRRDGPAGARHRHRRLGAHPGGGLRRRRPQAGASARSRPRASSRWSRASTRSGRWRARSPTARSRTPCSPARPCPAPRLRGLRVGVLTAVPDLAPPEAEPARDERALAHAERLRDARRGRPRGLAPGSGGRHVGGLLRRRPRPPTPRPSPAGATSTGRRSAPSSTRRSGSPPRRPRRAAGRCTPGGRGPTREPDVDLVVSPHARLRRAAAGRRRRARRAPGGLRLHARRSATSAGPRSRSARCSSPGATPTSSCGAALALEECQGGW